MIQVSTTVELEGGREGDHCGNIAFRRRFSTFLLGDVQVIDVSSVMLAAIT